MAEEAAADSLGGGTPCSRLMCLHTGKQKMNLLVFKPSNPKKHNSFLFWSQVTCAKTIGAHLAMQQTLVLLA